MIDEMEGQDLATDKITGSLLQTDYDNGDIHINMEGEMVTLLENIDLSYYKDFNSLYICSTKMYVCIIQEGYIRLHRGIINLLDKTLQDHRKMIYQRNEYYWCLMKKISKIKNALYYGIFST